MNCSVYILQNIMLPYRYSLLLALAPIIAVFYFKFLKHSWFKNQLLPSGKLTDTLVLFLM